MACSSLETIDQKEEFGRVKYTQDKKTKLKEGRLIRYDESGNKIEEAFYKNDQLQGQRSLFSPEGYLEVTENYVNGIFSGTYTAFFESGQVMTTGDYVNGTMEGSWKSYYKDGTLKEIVQFSNNEENGPFQEFHPNGKLKAEGTYLDGDQEDGPLKLYDETGTLVTEMNCVKGRCATVWQKPKS